MTSSARVKALYGETLPALYDDRAREGFIRRLGRRVYDFDALAREAVEASGLGPGDRVLVLCCGTGREFSAIRERIGETGFIVGVDFSATMLARAKAEVEREGWTNVRLVHADATTYAPAGRERFDVGVCTLGMSIMPAWGVTFDRLVAHVRSGGTIVVGDLRSAGGWRAALNPLVAWWARPYGASRAGHRNTAALFARMGRELAVAGRRSCAFGTYEYCVARKTDSPGYSTDALATPPEE